MSEENQLKIVRPFPALLVIGFWVQAFGLYRLWSHTSDMSDFLGRYSARYALVLAASVLAVVIWTVVAIRWRVVAARLEHLSMRWRFGVLAATGLLMLVVWLFPIERVAQEYVAANWLLLVVLLLQTLPDAPANRRWLWGLAALIIVLLPLLLVASLSVRKFEPDESIWAERGISVYIAGGLFQRTRLEPTVIIWPGLGWITAGYGWLLKNVSFSLAVGRIWQYVSYVLTFVLTGLVAWRLYGRTVGFVAAAAAVFSLSFWTFVEFRTNLQMPTIIMAATFCALQARSSQRSRAAVWWHTACGLLSTLAFQVHASAIFLAAGLGLVYLVEAGWNLYRSRRIAVVVPLVTFGIGAAVGAGLYYVLNIVSYGGLQAYLEALVWERGAFLRPLPALYRLLTWPNLAEVALVFAGLCFLLWRRNAADRLLLGIIGSIFLFALLLDTQGYLHTFNTLLLVPVGALLVDGLRGVAQELTRRGMLLSLSTALLMGVQVIALVIVPSGAVQTLRTGRLPPFLYEELRPALQPYIVDDDIIVSTHQLVWTFPYHLKLYGIIGEVYGMKRWNLDSAEAVWEHVQPTVVIEVEHQMDISEGLAAYMSNHNFQTCGRLSVMESAITIYREQCPS